MSLSFMNSLPEGCIKIDSFLRNKGFTCEEEETTDSLRWRYYYKEFKQCSSNVIIRVVLRFELFLSDGCPPYNYDDNHDLFFNDAYLEVFDRQIHEYEEVGTLFEEIIYNEETESICRIDSVEKIYNEETESICRIDSFAIDPETFEDIERFIDSFNSIL